MLGSRDDFSKDVKRTLPLRVAYLCSNPKCQNPTSGPNFDRNKATILGEAAHITAAAPGGPRYDPSLTPSERRDINNAIWLCVPCATLIDKDWKSYPSQLLNQWKLQAEAYAETRLKGGPGPTMGWSASNVLLTNHIDALSAHVSSGLSKELDTARQMRMEGRHHEARTWVRMQREDKHTWQVLPPNLQAKIISLEANLIIDEGIDFDKARALIAEAKETDPQYSTTRLSAALTYKTTGPEGALDLLRNSTDPSDLHFCAAIEMERGRIDSCLEFIAALEDKESAEALRLRALVSLYKKDTLNARSMILMAESHEPNWQAILFAKAAINYYCAVSPIAIPTQPLSCPEPLEWALVKQDAHSQNLLSDAAITFNSLIAFGTKSESERTFLEGWRLAAMANTYNLQNEATDFCRHLLRQHPTHRAAIAWAVTRLEGIDLSLSLQTLEALVTRNELAVNDIVSLVTIYFAADRFSDATKCLTSTRDTFVAEGCLVAWYSCLAQAFTLAGKPKDALSIIDSSGSASQLRGAELSALHRIAHECGDTTAFQSKLDALYETTHDSMLLLEQCKLAAHKEDWLYIAERGAELINIIGTSDTVRLVATSYYNTHKYTDCLDIIEANTHRFRHTTLPPELRRLRTLSRAALGYLSKAIIDAEDLARSEGKTEDLLRLVDLLLEKGDFHAIALEARRLLARPDFSVQDALWVANIIHSEDRTCASQLWRFAHATGIPDELVNDALYLAFRLGLDGEAHSLINRVNRFAAQGSHGVVVQSLEDLKSLIKRHRDDISHINELYRTGAAPIHILSEASRDSLVNIYHTYQTANATPVTPHLKAPLFIRNGRKAVVAELTTTSSYNLYMDVTAIMLAAHFDLLELVEEAFGTIHFSQQLQRALAAMRRDLEHPQPGRLNALNCIMQLINRGEFQVVPKESSPLKDWGELSDKVAFDWLALLERAQAENGYVLDFLPIRHKNLSGDVVSLPPEIAPFVINLRGIADILRSQGVMSSASYQEVLRLAGVESFLIRDFSHVLGTTTILCHANTPELLASVGLLEPCCGHFRVFIQESEVERIKRELLHEQAQTDIRRWLDSLIAHIRDGIERGSWKPLAVKANTEEDDVPAVGKGLVVQSLLELLGMNYGPEDLVWIDDRYLSAYDGIGPAAGRVIGISEILRLLRAKRLLSGEKYFEIQHRIRSGNARFLPVEKEEVLYCLRNAVIRDAQVQETRELKTLRQYFASCLLASDSFAKSDSHEFGLGEHQLILKHMSLPDDVLIAAWADMSVDEATCVAWCEWILDNLVIAPAGLVKVASIREIKDDEKHLKVSHVAGFIVKVFADATWTSANKRRKACLKWLYEKVMQRISLCANVIETVSSQQLV